MSYHAGELEAQRRAGVRDLAERVGRIIRPAIPAAAAEFLEAQTMIIAATRRRDGTVHASALLGPPGFARAAGAESIELRPNGGHLDTVLGDLAESSAFGMLAIEFATKRRMRANGFASAVSGVITLSTAEVYSNCPQYITPRNDRIELSAAAMRSTDSLTESQRRMIAAASTFFIASAHPEAGADASHRGGAPGFIRVEEDTISWPDYRGNNMFNTIGNLLVNPKCGLLFIDFECGASLQIEGSASVQWEEAGTRIEVSVKRAFTAK
jgi:predicted pyridoxine 5'-phosphate oxidase superfamily flavin-nucleotide-binding protein